MPNEARCRGRFWSWAKAGTRFSFVWVSEDVNDLVQVFLGLGSLWSLICLLFKLRRNCDFHQHSPCSVAINYNCMFFGASFLPINFESVSARCVVPIPSPGRLEGSSTRRRNPWGVIYCGQQQTRATHLDEVH